MSAREDPPFRMANTHHIVEAQWAMAHQAFPLEPTKGRITYYESYSGTRRDMQAGKAKSCRNNFQKKALTKENYLIKRKYERE